MVVYNVAISIFMLLASIQVKIKPFDTINITPFRSYLKLRGKIKSKLETHQKQTH
jgi:hypothetical protein